MLDPGSGARDGAGEPIGVEHQDAVSWCATGALNCAMYRHADSLEVPPPLQRACERAGAILKATVRALTLGHYTEPPTTTRPVTAAFFTPSTSPFPMPSGLQPSPSTELPSPERNPAMHEADNAAPLDPVISAYSRAQAIETASSSTSPTPRERRGIPVALTRTVWNRLVAIPEGYQGFQDERGRLWASSGWPATTRSAPPTATA